MNFLQLVILKIFIIYQAAAFLNVNQPRYFWKNHNFKAIELFLDKIKSRFKGNLFEKTIQLRVELFVYCFASFFFNFEKRRLTPTLILIFNFKSLKNDYLKRKNKLILKYKNCFPSNSSSSSTSFYSLYSKKENKLQ